MIFNIYRLLLIILLEGFVTISVEILTIRQLTPFVGNSVIVTSLIIGVFLLFLAIGYWRGGVYTGDYSRILKNNFTKAAIWLGLGLSYLFSGMVFYYFESIFLTNLLTALMVYLLLITAPIVYWLGQTVPITTNLFRKESHVGAISGKVLFLSTVGSFLGAVLTSLVLFNFLGVAWTVVINFICLVILAAMLIEKTWDDYLHVGILLVAGVIVFYLNVRVESTYLIRTNNYANYRVEPHQKLLDGREGKAFIVNDSLSSFLDENRKAASYAELIKKYLFKDMKLTGKKILVIGAGGFSLSAENNFGNEFIYLDIDKDIADLARQHYVGSIDGKFIPDDARNFVKSTKDVYDVIISDAYSNKNSMPAYLMTKEYIQQLRSLLKPDGIAVFNVIATATMQDKFSKRIDNTINSVFPNCIKAPTQYLDRLTNILYFCKTSEFENDKVVYTDNLNPVTLDYFTAMQRAYSIVHHNKSKAK